MFGLIATLPLLVAAGLPHQEQASAGLGDLTVSKTCTPATAPGPSLSSTCTLTVSNASGGYIKVPAQAVLVRDDLTYPAAVTVAATMTPGAGTSGYNCGPTPPTAGASQALACSAQQFDTLLPNQTRTFTLSLTLSTAANTLQTITDQSDRQPQRNDTGDDNEQ